MSPRERLPLPKGVPRTLRFESVTFDVMALGDGRLAFRYYDGTTPIVIKRKTIEALRNEASNIAETILNAETAAKDLTADQRRIAANAFAAIANTNLHLDTLAREAAEAEKILGGHFSVVELALFHSSRKSDRPEIPASAAILAEMLDQLREDTCEDKYVTGLENDLEPFVSTHPNLRTAGEAEIRAWLRTRKKRGGTDPIGTRRRDNLRDAVVRLYSFAGEREYLTTEEAAVAENIPRIAQRGDVSTFAPKEIALLLEHVSTRWFPWFVIAAFGGLRTSEIFRLEWKHIYWDVKDEEGHPKPVIGVPRRIAKKVRISRKVPMLANLQDLLQPYRNLVGPLYPHKKWRTLEDQHQDELNRLAKVTGLQWKNNVLRHSFGSHRLAIVKNIEQVAWEMGNSAPMVRESYNDPKDETEAKSYFAIRRPDHENVVTMPLGLHFAS